MFLWYQAGVADCPSALPHTIFLLACVSVQCQLTGCEECNMTGDKCRKCKDGYIRNAKGTCDVLPQVREPAST
jgi:hypothetical protein